MKVTIAVDISKISKQDYVNELRSSGQGDIARSISVVDNTTPETIQIDVDTEEEFNQILSSNKVAGAQTDRLELIGRISGSRSITANITSTVDISHHNWGLVASTQNSTTLATSYTYDNLGANVDCVIMDTGIVLNHPEFNNQANTSTRINQINWGGSQGSSFYTDPDGHGTHVAGIMAGRTQGWASDADIYSFTTNLSGYTHGYDISDIGYITTWHQNKSNGRPTIVNMSWGLSTYYPPNHPSHFITTAAWDPSSIPNSQYHMTRSQTYDTVIQNMVNAGIVVVCSAGNDNQRIYNTNESGWNLGYWYFFDSGNNMGYGVNEKIYFADASAYDTSLSPMAGLPGAPPGGSYGNTIYFQATNNGQTPSNAWLDSATSTRYDIAVQAHQSNKSKSSYSNYGEALTIYAPGDYIMSSYINKGSAVQLGSTGYYYNKLSGTSMASPQVAGVLACWLGRDTATYGAVSTNANQIDAVSFLQTNQRSDITDWGGGLTNLNRLYTPYQDYTITWSLGQGSATHNIGTFNPGDNFAYDLSATFRNAASEQLHTVTHTVTSGSLPQGTSIDSASGVTSGKIGTYLIDASPSFTLSVTNGFDNETKDYTLVVNGTGGITIEGVSFGGGVTVSG